MLTTATDAVSKPSFWGWGGPRFRASCSFHPPCLPPSTAPIRQGPAAAVLPVAAAAAAGGGGGGGFAVPMALAAGGGGGGAAIGQLQEGAVNWKGQQHPCTHAHLKASTLRVHRRFSFLFLPPTFFFLVSLSLSLSLSLCC